MKVRDAQKLRDMLLIIGTVMMLSSYFYKPLFVPGIVVACACLIPHFLYNKCPNCGKQLTTRTESKFCPHCGKKIDQ